MRTEMPLVSIITPVFNRAHLVGNTIDSVIAQSYTNWEMLLVDDGSSDSIEAMIQEKYGDEPRIRFYKRNREPKGASTCRNIGAERSKGSYLIFLDSDDWLETYCLEQRVQVMETYHNFDFAVFPFRYLKHDGSLQANNFDNGKDPLINFLSEESYWCIMCPIWRKEFFCRLGGFNTAFPRYQDPEIHIRALTTPDVEYKMCMDCKPDSLVIPSEKKPSVAFANDIADSLELLLPQTYQCLSAVGKAEWMVYMKGYLKSWLAFYAYTNFDNVMSKRTLALLELFLEFKVVSVSDIARVRYVIKITEFLAKALRKLFIVLLH